MFPAALTPEYAPGSDQGSQSAAGAFILSVPSKAAGVPPAVAIIPRLAARIVVGYSANRSGAFSRKRREFIAEVPAMGRTDRYPSGSRRSGQAIILDGAVVGCQHIRRTEKSVMGSEPPGRPARKNRPGAAIVAR